MTDCVNGGQVHANKLLSIRNSNQYKQLLLAFVLESVQKTMAWFKSEKKGMPIAVATPVATPVETRLQAECPQPSAPLQTSHDYHATTPSGMAAPQQVYMNQQANTLPITNGPLETQFLKLQNMGNRSQTHKMFVMVSIMAALSAVNNAVAQIIALRYPGNYHTEVLLRLYMIGFCILSVLLEVEFNVPLLRESFVLTNWISRGVFYSFLGLLGQSLYDVGYDNHFRRYRYAGNSNGGYGNNNARYYGVYGPRMPTTEDFAEWYVWMTSYLMFFVGVLYIVLGALCLQNKLREIRRQYQIREGR